VPNAAELPGVGRSFRMARCMGGYCMLVPSVPSAVSGSTHNAQHPCTVPSALLSAVSVTVVLPRPTVCC
jgi:hypothetical protein